MAWTIWYRPNVYVGFGPRVYNSKSYKHQLFKEILFSYIESGIPIIAITKKEINHHALLIIGRENNFDFKNIVKGPVLQKCGVELTGLFLKSNIIDFSSFYNDLVLIDDNRIPYIFGNSNSMIQRNKTIKVDQILSFIAPLYPKIHLEAFQFRRMLNILNDEYKSIENIKIKIFEKGKRQIVRSYITSSRSYKNFVATNQNFVDIVKDFIIEKSTPRFLWIAEIFSSSTWNENSLVDKIVVIDATESGYNCNLLFAINEHYIVTNVFADEFDSDESENAIDKNNETEVRGRGDYETIKNEELYTSYEINGKKIPTFARNLKGNHTLWHN